MKMILTAVVILAVFVGTIVGAMALTGNLTKERLERVVKGPPPPPPKEETPDDVGPWARALRDRETELDKREADLAEREKRVTQMLADLDELRTQVQDIQKQIRASLDAEDEDRGKRLDDIAKSLGQMKPANAAKTLDDWPVSDAADILRRVSERDRGKILDGMDPSKAAAILRALQEPKY